MVEFGGGEVEFEGESSTELRRRFVAIEEVRGCPRGRVLVEFVVNKVEFEGGS